MQTHTSSYVALLAISSVVGVRGWPWVEVGKGHDIARQNHRAAKWQDQLITGTMVIFVAQLLMVMTVVSMGKEVVQEILHGVRVHYKRNTARHWESKKHGGRI